ncbi:MAG: leader peptide processing enzyme [Spirochaetales bacterium]|nr:leader peptide processing enzyme [Candidatus Physcosoma equi]
MAKDKKMNPFVFMLIATLFNIALILVLFIAFMVIISLLGNALNLGDNVYSILVLACFIGAFAGAFFIYKKFVVWATKKWNVDESLFKRK